MKKVIWFLQLKNMEISILGPSWIKCYNQINIFKQVFYKIPINKSLLFCTSFFLRIPFNSKNTFILGGGNKIEFNVKDEIFTLERVKEKSQAGKTGFCPCCNKEVKPRRTSPWYIFLSAKLISQ